MSTQNFAHLDASKGEVAKAQPISGCYVASFTFNAAVSNVQANSGTIHITAQSIQPGIDYLYIKIASDTIP